MHTQIGFDLKHTKHYGSPERAQAEVEKKLKGLIDAGVVFNILIVSQRKGGMGTDAEDLRYIPLLSAFRVPKDYPGGPTQAQISAAWSGFYSFP